MIESIEKLREWSRWLDGAYAAEEGGHYHVYNRHLTASMKSCGELMREKCGEIEREIAEKYMLLPVDADGVPIHVGDELFNKNKPTDVYKVTAIADNGYIRIYHDTAHIHSSQCRHVKPRTLEDVLRDLVDGIGSVEFDALTAIGEAADEIRELMEVGK